MAKRRKSYDAPFKARVALEAIREREPVSQLTKRFKVHSTQIQDWKRRVVEGAAGLFENGSAATAARDSQESELYEQIGRLQMELEWVKKKAARFDG